MDDCLEIDDSEFDRLSQRRQLKIIYMNVKSFGSIKRTQRIQWVMIMGLWTTFVGFGAWIIDKLMGMGN